jgi:hypothetical protein
MRPVQDIVFGVTTGQTVYFDCPEGRPSSVTSASVYLWDVPDDDTAESAIGTPAVETNPNTTLDDVASAGSRTIPLTATTGAAAERVYLVTGATGLKEWTEVQTVTDGVSVTAKHPLHNDYASGSTFQSTRIQATIDASWIADDTNVTTEDSGPNPGYRVRWVYVVGGVTYVADSYFSVVRYAARHGIRPQDIESEAPGWLDTLPTDHRADQGRKLIENAYRKVKMDLHAIDLKASDIAESDVIDEFVILKTLELGEWSKLYAGAPDTGLAQLSSKKYMERLDAIARVVSRVPVRDNTGSATAVVATPAWRR